jgi:integrase
MRLRLQRQKKLLDGGRFEIYWSAVQDIQTWDSETGKHTTRRRTYSLGVKGAAQRRKAQRAMIALEERLQREGDRPASLIGANVHDAAQQYLASVCDSVRRRTMLSYSDWLRAFVERYGAMPVESLTAVHIEQWRAALLKRYAPTSVNTALRTVRAFCGWLVRAEAVPRSPFTGVKMVRVPERTFPPFITWQEFERAVLPTVHDARLRAGFCLAIYGGLRLREAASLRWSQVDTAAGVIRIESGDGFQTKSGRGRVVPLVQQLAAALDMLPRRGPYVLGDDRPADGTGLSHAWRRACEGVPEIARITYHGLRHSFATHCARLGLPLPALQAILGHADIQTSMLYAHIQPQQAAEYARKLLGE